MYDYSIKYFDTTDKTTQKAEGICGGNDYSEAAAILVDYYGAEIISMSLSEVDIVLDKNDIKDMFFNQERTNK